MLYNLAISLMRSGLSASAFCPKQHVVGLIESRNQPLQKKKNWSFVRWVWPFLWGAHFHLWVT